MRKSQIRFIHQQGFSGKTFPDSFYTALMLQPRIIGCVAAVGVLLQSPWIFLTLAAALWWSALVPTRNPFDATYNHLVANRRGLPRLGAALSPRRFAAGEAGTVALAAGVALVAGATTTAWIIEGLLIGGVISAVFANFCIGAYTFHLLRQLSPRARRHPAPGRDDQRLDGAPAVRPGRRSVLNYGCLTDPAPAIEKEKVGRSTRAGV